MKKMNRRDYLISMGATAGVIAGTPKLDVFAQRDPRSSPPQRPTTQRDTSKIFEQKGIRKFDLHTTESVKLVFSGLMAFWRNADEHCLIGFHSMPSDNHKHQLMVTAYRKEDGGKCAELNQKEKIVLPGERLEVEITRPDVLDGVYFFQPPPTSGKMHDNDFRWVADLESSSWYDQPLDKKSVHNPVLKVRNGLFYTLMRTASTFRRQKADGSGAWYIGHIAEYVGTNIYLESGGRVTLTLPKEAIEMPKAPNVKYEVHFMNYCLDNGSGKACDFNGYHTNKIKRSDFYMHFHSLKLDPNDEYELVVAQGMKGPGPDICGTSKGSDESPCSVYGFGGRDGFPSFP